MLREEGSYLVELENGILLHVLHMNTVENLKLNGTVFSRQLQKYTEIQYNTTKTKLLSVSDKKGLACNTATKTHG